MNKIATLIALSIISFTVNADPATTNEPQTKETPQLDYIENLIKTETNIRKIKGFDFFAFKKEEKGFQLQTLSEKYKAFCEENNGIYFHNKKKTFPNENIKSTETTEKEFNNKYLSEEGNEVVKNLMNKVSALKPQKEIFRCKTPEREHYFVAFKKEMSDNDLIILSQGKSIREIMMAFKNNLNLEEVLQKLK